ncbi:MAG: hypothetical protein QF554_08750 [Dehalococcoidia bacterium]|nr:hypothetical protein [Dehalococcoidia bacterium]
MTKLPALRTHLDRLALSALASVAVLLLLACSSSGHGPPVPGFLKGPDVYEEVWSQTSPVGTSWEYKVNCSGDPPTLEPCFLSDLSAVRVIAPDGSLTELEKDFNINDYSGEVTRRWVLYGPREGDPPATGAYTFEYLKADEVVRSHTIDYTQSHIGYPTGVKWQRVGNDVAVQWDAPAGVEKGMWYKVIIGSEGDTPEAFVSQVFEWDAESATLPDVPLLDGGSYYLSVAVFYRGGYAYPEDEIFDW